MRFSNLFTKTLKETPALEKSINASFLIRGGFISQLSAGIYTFLPLGLRVRRKLETIIREEMDRIGGQEVLMPALHPKENWTKTGRWKYPEMFKVKSRSGSDYSLGWTHEEIITPLFKKFVKSYKDLPFYGYQIQTKFRDELRAKSGLLRLREFAMKDLYSFHATQKDLDSYYERVKKAYFRICRRIGLDKFTYFTFASGGAFSKFSHEFQTETEAGEDTIYLCERCRIAINKEIIGEQKVCPGCQGKDFEIKKAIEIANIFKLGTRFSKPFNLLFTDNNGARKEILMGCYGFGIERVIGTVVEVYHDERGIIWPKNLAPFEIHLINLEGNLRESEKIYWHLLNSGLEVLWDDREETPGVKFADADLIGNPLRVVISSKTLKSKKAEIKLRNKKKLEFVSWRNLASKVKEELR